MDSKVNTRALPFDLDPVIEAYKKDIDRTLIRENLKLTVTQRFEKLMALQRFQEEMQRAGRAARTGGMTDFRGLLESLSQDSDPLVRSPAAEAIKTSSHTPFC